MRTIYMNDRDKISHSHSFQTLAAKSHFLVLSDKNALRQRNLLQYTLEVARFSRSIARDLKLNEDLTEAIALAHEIGHPPFGRVGEAALNDLHSCGFRHSSHTLRVLDHLEGDSGLNLSFEVRDGILKHAWGSHMPSFFRNDVLLSITLEGRIIGLIDWLINVNLTLEDAINLKQIKKADIPIEITRMMGSTYGERMNIVTDSIINESRDSSEIRIAHGLLEAVQLLNEFLNERFYNTEYMCSNRDQMTAMIQDVYYHYLDHPEDMSAADGSFLDLEDLETRVLDTVASFSDQELLSEYKRIH